MILNYFELLKHKTLGDIVINIFYAKHHKAWIVKAHFSNFNRFGELPRVENSTFFNF